jgi:hypothetical protein
MRYAPRDGLPAGGAGIPVAGHVHLFVVRAFKLGRLGCQGLLGDLSGLRNPLAGHYLSSF